MKLFKKWLARTSIQRKLFVTLASGFLGFILFFAASFAITTNNQKVMTALVEVHFPMLEKADKLARGLGAVKTATVQAAFSGSMDGISAMEKANARVLEDLGAIRKLKGGAIEDLDASQEKYATAYKETSEILQNVVAGIEQLSSVQAKLQQYSQEFSKLEAWAIELKNKQSEEFKASVASANTGSRRAIFAGLALLCAMIPFGLLFYVITRDVARGLKGLSRELEEVSRNMLKISSETSMSSGKLTAAATEQAASANESATSMEQMKNKLGQTVRNSAEALRSSEESFKEAADGKFAIDSLRSAMAEIEQSYKQLEEVNQVVRVIGEKTNIINDIVFKTQLLSFNASIEAARAGQHGRGFAVVASEVGKLADMSGRASQEIERLLGTSTQKVAEVVNSTKRRIESANSISQKCAAVFEGITSRAGQVKTMVNSITEAAADQESGIHQVVSAMNEMQGSAEETNKMAHLMSQLSGYLKGHSAALVSTMERMDSLVHGQQGTAKESDKIIPIETRRAA